MKAPCAHEARSLFVSQKKPQDKHRYLDLRRLGQGNDVHLELEDGDNDVIHIVIIHVVIPPLRFKVVMKKLRMTKLKVLSWRKMVSKG